MTMFPKDAKCTIKNFAVFGSANECGMCSPVHIGLFLNAYFVECFHEGEHTVDWRNDSDSA